MTRDEVVALLHLRLNRTDLEAKIISEMVFVQSFQLEGTGAFLPWFLESEMANANAGEGEERVLLPDDFLGEIEEQSLWLYDATNEDAPYTELHKSAYDRLILRHQISGTPREYALAGDYILLRPIPDATYNLRMRYYAADASLATENIENKWLKHAADWLMAEVGAKIAATHIRNLPLAKEFKQDAAIARQRVYTKHEARKHTNRTYGMGED